MQRGSWAHSYGCFVSAPSSPHRQVDSGKEVDYLHLGKVAKIEVQAADVIISLKPTGVGKKKQTRVLCTVHQPCP